jgi:Fe2+ or Zn2+ uptake regulation protein
VITAGVEFPPEHRRSGHGGRLRSPISRSAPSRTAEGAADLDSIKESRDDGAVPDTADLERSLRAAGLRVTRPRLAVLDAVHAHPHVDTEALIGAARTRLGTVSHQAVYDVLRVLTHRGLVRRIQPQGAVARYEARVGDNHHHLVCRSCDRISDVDCAVGAAPCLTPDDGQGFLVDEAEVVYWGTCPSCTAGPTTSSHSDRPAAERGTT